MDRLYCPVCTFGCNDQSIWVAHLVSEGHRTARLGQPLWNWPLHKDERSIVIPFPEDQDEEDYESFLLDALRHFVKLSPSSVEDAFVDLPWKLCIIVLTSWDITLHLLKKTAPHFNLLVEEPISLKSLYFLKPRNYNTLERNYLGHPGKEEDPKNSFIGDINYVMNSMKNAPLNLNQQLLYLLENYAVTRLEIDLQQSVFDDLSALVKQGLPLFQISLTEGGLTHFGYKYDPIRVNMSIPVWWSRLVNIDSSAIIGNIQKAIASCGSFTDPTLTFEPTPTSNLLQEVQLKFKHRTVPIMVLLTCNFSPEAVVDPFGPSLYAFLLSFDKRAMPLATFLLLWNSHRKIYLPASAIISLVLVFLMKKGALPSISMLQEICPANSRLISEEGWDFSVCIEENRIATVFKGLPMKSHSTGREADGSFYNGKEVLVWAMEFFEFFIQYNLEKHVVSMLIGELVPRENFLPGNEVKLPPSLKLKYLQTPEGQLRGQNQKLQVGAEFTAVFQHPFNLSKNYVRGPSLVEKVQKFGIRCEKDANKVWRLFNHQNGRLPCFFLETIVTKVRRGEAKSAPVLIDLELEPEVFALKNTDSPVLKIPSSTDIRKNSDSNAVFIDLEEISSDEEFLDEIHRKELHVTDLEKISNSKGITAACLVNLATPPASPVASDTASLPCLKTASQNGNVGGINDRITGRRDLSIFTQRTPLSTFLVEPQGSPFNRKIFFDVTTTNFVKMMGKELKPFLTKNNKAEISMKTKNLWLMFIVDFFNDVWKESFGIEVTSKSSHTFKILNTDENNPPKAKRSRLAEKSPSWFSKWERISSENESYTQRFCLRLKTKYWLDRQRNAEALEKKLPGFQDLYSPLLSEGAVSKLCHEKFILDRALDQSYNQTRESWANRDITELEIEPQFSVEVSIRTTEKTTLRRENHNAYFVFRTLSPAHDVPNNAILCLVKVLERMIPRYANHRLKEWL